MFLYFSHSCYKGSKILYCKQENSVILAFDKTNKIYNKFFAKLFAISYFSYFWRKFFRNVFAFASPSYYF